MFTTTTRMIAREMSNLLGKGIYSLSVRSGPREDTCPNARNRTPPAVEHSTWRDSNGTPRSSRNVVLVQVSQAKQLITATTGSTTESPAGVTGRWQHVEIRTSWYCLRMGRYKFHNSYGGGLSLSRGVVTCWSHNPPRWGYLTEHWRDRYRVDKDGRHTEWRPQNFDQFERVIVCSRTSVADNGTII